MRYPKLVWHKMSCQSLNSYLDVTNGIWLVLKYIRKRNLNMKSEVSLLEEEIARALKVGRHDAVNSLWARIVKIDPNHIGGLTALGQNAFRAGYLEEAKKWLSRSVEVDGSDQQQWINLAVVCQGLRDEIGEEQAIRGALVVAPSDMLALILRANLLERQGKVHAAAGVYNAVVAVAPPIEQLNQNLRPAVIRAMEYREKYNQQFGSFLDDYLAPFFQDMQGENLKRFRDSVDIMFGRKKRYESQSMIYHYPGLAPVTFFERSDFSWLDEVEAATDAIRDEFLAVLESEQGFTPYLTYPPDQPHNQFAELNNSPRWSALHLYQNGLPVEENLARCPETKRVLAGTPMPDQPGRTPTAMFSLLKPHTHIPPHVGVSNARLVAHLPLIIPEKCGFRVGDDIREWVPGKAWVFDDTILHEAWNQSDKLRVILIFDIWHPHLSVAERAMIKAMTDGINAFSDDSGGFEL